MIVLWGSNAREAHPIFFHRVIQAVRRGAKLFVVDPRGTASAAWADAWLPVAPGTDIALAHAIAHEIFAAGLEHHEFIRHATVGVDAYRASLADYSPERTAAITGVSPALVRQIAHAYARADRAMLCWTLGITEHHNAVDNVQALINLALATGHVGRRGSGLNPLRGQNNVQGGGDMGALPNKLPGFQDVEDPVVRGRFNAAWGCIIPPMRGWHLTDMFHAMGRGDLRALWVLGENPARSEADGGHTVKLLEGLDHLIVQDLFLTQTAEMASVVLPATAAWCESEGTVTNSERRVQRVRKAVDPPRGARDDLDILGAIALRLGKHLGETTPRSLWDEVRTLSPMHRGMSYARLEALGGIQWPCPDETHPGTEFLHERLWKDPPVQGALAPFSIVHHDGPAEALSTHYPLRLTTGRRLDAFNTGVQSSALRSPLHRAETLDMALEDARLLDLSTGDRVRVSSLRGSVVTSVRIDPGLRPGLAFMTIHDPDTVDTNLLTLDASDPRSGTSEFKAAAIRVDKLASTEATE